MLGAIVKKARERREAKAKQRLLRKVDTLEKLLDAMPANYALFEWYRLIREVIPQIRASDPPAAAEWLERYEARMRERDYPEDKIRAALEKVAPDLSESPKDAADDEMFDWENK